MTFLELVRRACLDSGTIANNAPVSVVGAPGILGRWVNWTRDAYRDIQTEYPSWKWLRAEGEGTLITGQNRFSATLLGATRFRSWRATSDRGLNLWTIYDPAKGLRDEEEVWLSDYDMVLRGSRGEIQTGRPQNLAIDDQGQIMTWPYPDRDYRLRYHYNRAPQELMLDNDVPEMPEAQHMAIVFLAMLKNLNFDQALEQYPAWKGEYERHMAQLRETQLPDLEWGAPLV